MSRCEKLTLVACLGVLFVSIVHLYRLQSKTSVRSLHVFVQPAIIPQSVIPEYNEENILFASESLSKIDSLREGTTSSETFPTSSYGLTPTTTEFNSVVFYNRWSIFAWKGKLSCHQGFQRLAQKTWPSSSSSCQNRTSSSNGGFLGMVAVLCQQSSRAAWKSCSVGARSRSVLSLSLLFIFLLLLFIFILFIGADYLRRAHSLSPNCSLWQSSLLDHHGEEREIHRFTIYQKQTSPFMTYIFLLSGLLFI